MACQEMDDELNFDEESESGGKHCEENGNICSGEVKLRKSRPGKRIRNAQRMKIELPSKIAKYDVDTQCNFFHAAGYHKGIQVNVCKDTADNFVQTRKVEQMCRQIQTEGLGNVKEYSNEVHSAVAALQNTDLLIEVFQALKEKDQMSDFVTLLQCLRDGKLPTDNIAWLCLLDRAKYASCKSTTQMKYRRETVEFWNIVYLLFGNSALTVFRGPANFSQVVTEKCRRGIYDPQKGSCNFSVPSIPTLRKTDTGFDRKIPPGFIRTSLDLAEKQSSDGKQFTLCFDSKKVAEGCKDAADGDVHLMDLEKPKLRHKLRIYQQQMEFAEELLDIRFIANLSAHSLKVQRCISKVSKVIWNLQRSITAKTISFNALKAQHEGNVRSEKRFQYTMSLINVKKHECENNLKRALKLNERLLALVANCKGLSSCFGDACYYNLAWSPLAFCLLQPEYVGQFVDLNNSPFLIKQCSELWFEKRKTARVTGSTMFNALGLDQFQLQTDHYNTFVKGLPKVFDADTREKFAYGTVNEINALCTIVSRLIPSYFGPCTRFYECGMIFLGTEECPNMLEVSADGMIECGMGGEFCTHKDEHFGHGERLAVELKCCYPRKDLPHLPYDRMPPRYVTQCLAEMKALKCETMIFACWTPKSTAVFLVHFDEELWIKIFALACKFYGGRICKAQSKWDPESKELAPLLRKFVDTHCKLLCILPSVYGEEGDMVAGDLQSPYRKCQNLEVDNADVQNIIKETEKCATEAKEVFTHCHNSLRNPAQEVMVWMLNCKDRIQEKNVPNSVPICYHMKGRQFKMKTARDLVEIVRDELHSRKINILCEVYDGQFLPIIVKSAKGEPLTKLQLYKETWHKACNMNKEHLLSAMMETCQLTVAENDLLMCIRSLPAGCKKYGRMMLDITRNPTKIIIGSAGGSNFPEAVASKFRYAPLSEEDKLKWNKTSGSKRKHENKLGLKETERNLLEAIHPELLEELSDLVENQDEENSLQEHELPDLIKLDTPLERLLKSNDFKLVQDIRQALEDHDFNKWKNHSLDFFYPTMLTSTSALNEQCVKKDLEVIAKVLQRYTTSRKWFDSSEKKYFNVNLIASAFGAQVLLQPPEAKQKRKFNPPSLINCCKAEIMKPSYPLVSLRVSYAKVLQEYKMKEWIEKAKVPMSLPVPDRDSHIELYSYPEYSEKRRQVECRTFDPVHVLTKVRGHLCRHGYKYAKKEAFQELAMKKPHILSRSVVFDHLDPQNAFVAEKVISETVEDEIRKMGYIETSDFLLLFRHFFRSLNDRGLPADTRMAAMFDMHTFLLKDVKLDRFPPSDGMQYINGMPVQTFESILQMISTRFTLFALAVGKNFNMRAVTTLPCESFFSDITRCDREGHLYPKAANIPRLMGRCVTLNYAKHNPKKAYELCTSNKAAYPVHLALHDRQRFDEETEDDYDGMYRDNFFDFHDDHRSSRVRRCDVTKGLTPMRTVQGVRQWFRTDESKINPAHRVNFPILENEK